MTLWTCPNEDCHFDNQLAADALCPLCGAKASSFGFEELGRLLQSKHEHKKVRTRKGREARSLEVAKYCPRCGSPNLNFLIYFRPSVWKCLDCSYEGAFVLEGRELASKIREKYQKASGQSRD